jgi:hypothetical protein
MCEIKWLIIGRYQMPTGRYQMPTGRYQMPIGRYQMPTGRYQMPIGRYQMPIGRYQMPTGRYQMPIGRYQISQCLCGLDLTIKHIPDLSSSDRIRRLIAGLSRLICGILWKGLVFLGSGESTSIFSSSSHKVSLQSPILWRFVGEAC